MPRGIFKRTEDHNRKVGEGLRRFYRSKRISEGLKKFHEKKKIDEEQRDKDQRLEKTNESDSTVSCIEKEDMSRDELLDKRAEVTRNILNRIKLLSRYWDGLMDMQKERDKIEERLKEIGSLGSLQSSAKDWEQK